MKRLSKQFRVALIGLLYVSTLLFTPFVSAQNVPSKEQVIAASVVQGLIDSGMTGDALTQLIAQVAQSAALLNPSAAVEIAAALTRLNPSSAAAIAAAVAIANPAEKVAISAAVAAVNPSAASEIDAAIEVAIHSFIASSAQEISTALVAQNSESTVNSVQVTADVIVSKLNRDMAQCNGNAACIAKAVEVAKAQALLSSGGVSQQYTLIVSQVQQAASPN